jgi:hypothetical protein
MYPLLLRREEDDYLGSSSGGSSSLYWNIVFYNTSTNEYHLLDEQRKMLISEYDLKENESHSRSLSSSVSDMHLQEGVNQVRKLIFYSIRTTDYNHDGVLNGLDPTYLFASDKTGHNFRQISPDSADVDEWQALDHTDKVLLQINRDTNGDNKFNSEDKLTPMIYSITTGAPAKEVFSPEFKDKAKQQLNAQWPQPQ